MILRCFGSGSSGNCYALMNDNEILILDCGVKYKEVLKGIDYRIGDVVGVIATHSHADHIKYAEEFEQACIEVFKPYLGGKQSKKFGGFTVHAFDVPHDGVECRGFLIEHSDFGKMLYMTDIEYCKYSFKSHKVSTMLIEANYDKSYLTDVEIKKRHVLLGHQEISVCLKSIEANKTDSLKNVILCHLSQQSACPSEFVERAQKVVGKGIYVDVAVKGFEVEI